MYSCGSHWSEPHSSQWSFWSSHFLHLIFRHIIMSMQVRIWQPKKIDSEFRDQSRCRCWARFSSECENHRSDRLQQLAQWRLRNYRKLHGTSRSHGSLSVLIGNAWHTHARIPHNFHVNLIHNVGEWGKIKSFRWPMQTESWCDSGRKLPGMAMPCNRSTTWKAANRYPHTHRMWSGRVRIEYSEIGSVVFTFGRVVCPAYRLDREHRGTGQRLCAAVPFAVIYVLLRFFFVYKRRYTKIRPNGISTHAGQRPFYRRWLVCVCVHCILKTPCSS